VVSLVHHGRPVVLLATGRRAGPGSPPIAAGSRFNLGSASKMFTAVAVAQLIDTGKVALDDPVGKFVPGLTAEASAVTVRQLLTHTSGLGDFFAPQNMAAMMRARTASDLLPLVADQKPAFPPGTRFAYSNTGFALLGIVVERVSGQTYAEYLRTRVFAPAGMKDTGRDPEPLACLAVGMTAHQPGMSPGQPAPPGPLHPAPGATHGFGSPAGGLYSTAGDMQLFFTALAAHRLASPWITAGLTAPQFTVEPAGEGKPARSYGYGFGTGVFEGHRWFGHNGGSLGVNAEAAAFPDDGWTAVVLSNRDPPAATRLFRYARALILHSGALGACPPLAD
jgi:CubicO group peptidase (beta-lactamase class C family)